MTGAAALGGYGVLTSLTGNGSGDVGPVDLTGTVIDPGDLQLRPGDPSHPGRVTVLTADGRELVHFDGYRLSDDASTGAATVTSPDASTVHLDYGINAPNPAGYSAAVTWRATGGTVTGTWEIRTPDGTVGAAPTDPVDGRLLRTLVDAGAPLETHVPATRWARDPRGGVPYLERVTEHHFADWADGDSHFSAVITVPGSRSHRPGYIHAPAPRGDDAIGRFTVTLRTDPAVAEARTLVAAGRPLLAGGVLGHPGLPDPLIDIHGPGPHAVLTAGGHQTFTLGLAGAPGHSGTVDILARDFDGVEVHHSVVELTVPEDARHGDTTVTVTLPQGRNWYSIDATCGDALARTSAAVWPEHPFGPAEGSIIGIGGFSVAATEAEIAGQGTIPGDPNDEIALWERLGVRFLREPRLAADQAGKLGVRTALHPAAAPGKFDNPDGPSFDEWTADILAQGTKSGVAHYELLNEWNADTSVPVADLAAEYTDRWLRPFRSAMDRADTDAALISMGLAGWDAPFLDAVRDHDGWRLLDGIAVHPGRGNYTADYDGARWNFAGKTRLARAYLDGHPGPTQLWLTEAYACTHPNSWWNDTEREAADATLLTLLIAKALGVTGVNWYQLTDGVWFDRYGVNPADPEYHYGLFHVDRSPKPSAAAFAFAAEILDGAVFLGWLESPHPDLRGLRFVRDGEVHWVLWSRQDGYINHATRTVNGFFAHPEVWETPAGQSLQVSVPVQLAGGDRPGTLRVRDVLGREIIPGPPVNSGTGPEYIVTVGASPVVVTGNIDESLTGVHRVAGDAAVALTGVGVVRDGTNLIIDGVNDSGADLELRVMGGQVAGGVPEVTLTVPQGWFSQAVDLGAAMPDEAGGPAASATGVTPDSRPQVRIVAERQGKVSPDAVQPQVWRAEYYRYV